jgi:hypothetical protein
MLEFSAVAVLVGPVQNIFNLTVLDFNLWAGSHAGPPVSECVTQGKTLGLKNEMKKQPNYYCRLANLSTFLCFYGLMCGGHMR